MFCAIRTPVDSRPADSLNHAALPWAQNILKQKQYCAGDRQGIQSQGTRGELTLTSASSESTVQVILSLIGTAVAGGRPHKDAKKGKASKAELLESAKRRQEQLKSLEGTREGRVITFTGAYLRSSAMHIVLPCDILACRSTLLQTQKRHLVA